MALGMVSKSERQWRHANELLNKNTAKQRVAKMKATTPSAFSTSAMGPKSSWAENFLTYENKFSPVLSFDSRYHETEL